MNQRAERAEGPQRRAALSPGIRLTPARCRASRKQGRRPEQAVWVLDENNKPQRVVRHAGESDGTYTEVTDGAPEGRRPRDRCGVGEGQQQRGFGRQPRSQAAAIRAAGRGMGF